ncbi:MAG: hypothetical protein R3F37_23170 [Candidatus Competibacteraceae bacterium]
MPLPMTTQSKSPPTASLPAERAFVIQLQEDPAGTAAPLQGRIEHILTGQSQRFGSEQELIEGLRELLAAQLKSR